MILRFCERIVVVLKEVNLGSKFQWVCYREKIVSLCKICCRGDGEIRSGNILEIRDRIFGNINGNLKVIGVDVVGVSKVLKVEESFGLGIRRVFKCV